MCTLEEMARNKILKILWTKECISLLGTKIPRTKEWRNMQNVQKDNQPNSANLWSIFPTLNRNIQKKKKKENRLSHQFDAYLTITFTFRTILTLIFG